MAGEPLYLAIDQGTHASRAVVLDRRGEVLASASRGIGLVRPHADWAEQDGDGMVASIVEAVAAALSSPGIRVIPAKAGIQLFQNVLDPGVRRGDDQRDFLRVRQS